MSSAAFTDLVALTTPAVGDILAIVDVSDSTQSPSGSTKQITLANVFVRGTVTTSQPIINATQTWNAGGVTFAGVKIAITNTASAAASLPFQILGGVGGVTNLFSIRIDGLTTMAGQLKNSGNGGVSIGTADGQGNIGTTTLGGLNLLGQGTTNDFTLLNKGGGTVLSVPTNTATVNVFGPVRVQYTDAAITAYDTQAAGVGAGGILNLSGKIDTAAETILASVEASLTSGAAGGTADVLIRTVAAGVFATRITANSTGVTLATLPLTGVTTITATGLLQVTATTQQLGLRYDGSNYCAVTVGSAGSTTFALTGTSPTFVFSQSVAVTGVVSGSTGVAVTSGQKVSLDGVSGTGDTYIAEDSTPNQINVVAGGVTALGISSTTIAFAANFTVVTSASSTTRAGLTLPAGTAPTSPISGNFWYDGTNLKFRDGVTTRTITWT